MRNTRLHIALIWVTFLAAACGSSTTPTVAPASTTGAPTVSAGDSAQPSTVPTGAATATAPGSPTDGASAPASGTPAPSGSCTPDAPTATSSGWNTVQSHGNDYTFKFPTTWDKLYGSPPFVTSSLIDAETFAETGLPANSETSADVVRTPTVAIPSATVLVIPGVVSSTQVVFDRQVKRFQANPDVSNINAALTGCLGGEPMLGVELLYNKGTTYQRSWYVVRNGRSYDLQWVAAKGQEAQDTLAEIVRTWQWLPNVAVATPLPTQSGGPAPSGASPSVAPTNQAPTPTPAPTVSAFVLAGMATSVKTSAAAADPKTFVSTIPKTATTFFAVFALQPGLVGEVDGVLIQGTNTLLTVSVQYTATNTWGDFKINSDKGIAPGAYVMQITYRPTGEAIQIPFTVK